MEDVVFLLRAVEAFSLLPSSLSSSSSLSFGIDKVDRIDWVLLVVIIPWLLSLLSWITGFCRLKLIGVGFRYRTGNNNTEKLEVKKIGSESRKTKLGITTTKIVTETFYLLVVLVVVYNTISFHYLYFFV